MGDEEKRAAVAAADLFTSTATRSRTAVLAFTQEELHARRLGTAHERLAMTTQLLSPSFIPATLERPSFWRRWGDAFEATQRRRAEQVITAQLRRHGGEHHNEFSRELERRFVGQ